MTTLRQLNPVRLGLALTLMACAEMSTHASNSETLASPNGSVTATITAGNQLDYSVQFNGKDVLLNSPFSLNFPGSQPFGPDLTIKNVSRRTVDESWQRVYGKRKQVRNHFNEL